jgi:hypothetical protein
MNDPQSTPPLIPASPATSGPPSLPLGATPDETLPIPNFIGAIEAILRQPRRVVFQLGQPGSGRLIAAMLTVSVVCGLIYGVVAGTFSGGTQLWAAPVKIAGGLLLSAFICLPSLYIFSCLSGSSARLSEIFGFVAGLLLLMTVLLIGFAPVAWIFSQSTESVVAMGALHLAFWFIATCFGLRFLNAAFAHHSRSGDGLKVWVAIFLLVMLQMTAALRPILGTADTFLPKEKQFFISHWIESLRARK